MGDVVSIQEAYGTAQGALLKFNPYGYRVNINHPLIRPLYERYKKWKKIPHGAALSDEERFEFEKYILEKIGKKDPGELERMET